MLSRNDDLNRLQESYDIPRLGATLATYVLR